MAEWRARYRASEYPEKVAKNLVYEGLTIEVLWDKFIDSFDTPLNGSVGDFSEGWGLIQNQRQKIQTGNVLPLLESKWRTISAVPLVDVAGLRSRVKRASQGATAEIEEIDFSYYFSTVAYETAYGWFAAGLSGLDYQEAYEAVCPVKFSGIDWRDPSLVLGAFGRASNFYYR